MYPFFLRKEFVLNFLLMAQETHETCVLLSAEDCTLLEPPVTLKNTEVFILLPIFAEKKSAAPDSRHSFSPSVLHDHFQLPPIGTLGEKVGEEYGSRDWPVPRLTLALANHGGQILRRFFRRVSRLEPLACVSG